MQYRIGVCLKIYHGPYHGYTLQACHYLSETFPDVLTLRASGGVHDVSVYDRTTQTYCRPEISPAHREA